MSASFARRALRAATQTAVAASLVAAVATTVHAQQPVTKDPPAGQPPAGGGGGGGGRGGARGMQMMMEGITLSDAQKTKIDSIVTDYAAKMPRREQGVQPTDEQRAQMQKMNADRTAAIKAVLTAEQAKQFDTNMENMRSRMGGGGRPPAGI